MKLNRKGFMMAEVVVVSAIVLIFLAGLFTSYNQMYGKYKSRIKYYDSVTLYQLAYYRDALIDNHQIETVLNEAKNNTIKDVYDNKETFIIYNNGHNLNENEFDGISDIHATYKDYLKYLAGSVDFTDTNYVMISERCSNADDCKYAYLKIYDGNEYSNSQSPSSPSLNCNCLHWKYVCGAWDEWGSCTTYDNSDLTVQCEKCLNGAYRCRVRQCWKECEECS